MGKFLTREQILAKKNDIKTEEFDVPEWDGAVLLRELTGRERDQFEASTVETKGNKTKQNLANIRAKLIALCIVNEDGLRTFSPPDIKELGELSAVGLNRVFTKCQEMNGFTEADVKELAEVFDDGQSDDSTSV